MSKVTLRFGFSPCKEMAERTSAGTPCFFNLSKPSGEASQAHRRSSIILTISFLLKPAFDNFTTSSSERCYWSLRTYGLGRSWLFQLTMLTVSALPLGKGILGQTVWGPEPAAWPNIA